MPKPLATIRPTYLSFQEASDLISQVKTIAKGDPWARSSLALLLCYGLRRHELLALQLEDMSKDRIEIASGQAFHAHHNRHLPKVERLMVDINEVVVNQPSGPLLSGPRHLDQCMRLIRQAANNAGIQKRVTSLSLRRTSITLLSRAGVAIQTLYAFAGIHCKWWLSHAPTSGKEDDLFRILADLAEQLHF